MSDTSAAVPMESPVTRQSVEFLALPRFAILLAVLLLASFPGVMFGWRRFFTRDFANFGYPLAWHVQQSYRAGEIPLWNPYNFAGLPFLAQWNTLALYPPSLIYILLPLPWSLNWFNLLHLYLGGLGMFCLARRWLRDGRAASVAGVAYAFSGLMVSSLMWPNNIAALGWLPVVVLAGERAAFASGEWTLSWAGLGNFLVPLFHTVQNRDRIFFQPDQQWVSSYYPGSAIVLLSLMALVSARTRRVRWLAVFCLVSLALALGTHGFVYVWLRRTTPGFGLMRYP